MKANTMQRRMLEKLAGERAAQKAPSGALRGFAPHWFCEARLLFWF
jgi:hypothetical protein